MEPSIVYNKLCWSIVALTLSSFQLLVGAMTACLFGYKNLAAFLFIQRQQEQWLDVSVPPSRDSFFWILLLACHYFGIEQEGFNPASRFKNMMLFHMLILLLACHYFGTEQEGFSPASRFKNMILFHMLIFKLYS